MLPTFPKIVPRRVIAVIVLILLALIIGFSLAAHNPRNPNYYLTPVFAATLTPK
jgi:peptidoglycan/LPS O-acetylase OafA/YrhL